MLLLLLLLCLSACRSLQTTHSSQLRPKRSTIARRDKARAQQQILQAHHQQLLAQQQQQQQAVSAGVLPSTAATAGDAAVVDLTMSTSNTDPATPTLEAPALAVAADPATGDEVIDSTKPSTAAAAAAAPTTAAPAVSSTPEVVAAAAPVSVPASVENAAHPTATQPATAPPEAATAAAAAAAAYSPTQRRKLLAKQGRKAFKHAAGFSAIADALGSNAQRSGAAASAACVLPAKPSGSAVDVLATAAATAGDVGQQQQVHDELHLSKSYMLLCGEEEHLQDNMTTASPPPPAAAAAAAAEAGDAATPSIAPPAAAANPGEGTSAAAAAAAGCEYAGAQPHVSAAASREGLLLKRKR
jgi:hypothetical protein